MFKHRPSGQRGLAEHGWLTSRHTFSFASYDDPAHAGFGSLRVINEDRIQGGYGFPMHFHQDVEVITYVLSGALRHRDSLGHEGVLKAGEVQKFSAGTGITHSEHNASAEQELHLMQIWILPDQAGIKPSYSQAAFPRPSKLNRWKLVLSPDGRDESLAVQQDALLWASVLEPGHGLDYPLAPGRSAWIQVLSGALEVNGEMLAEGDALAASAVGQLVFKTSLETEFLLFDLKSPRTP